MASVTGHFTLGLFNSSNNNETEHSSTLAPRTCINVWFCDKDINNEIT